MVKGELEIVRKLIQIVHSALRSPDIFNNLRQVKTNVRSVRPLRTTVTPLLRMCVKVLWDQRLKREKKKAESFTEV